VFIGQPVFSRSGSLINGNKGIGKSVVY